MAELARIEDALTVLKAGGMVILVDDEDRENEGDFVVAASCVTPEQVNFMATFGRGLICIALTPERCDDLRLTPMARKNTAPLGTAFTRSVDLRGLPGVGAIARAAAMQGLADPSKHSDDFITPGHVMPLRAQPGGVLVRTGQTEGSVDLARLAGLEPAGVICEVMASDGTMARLPSLLAFGDEHGIPVVSVADLIRYRLEHEQLVTCVSDAKMPTDHGEFRLRCFENTASGQVHIALTCGEPFGDTPTLVRVHRADTVSDVLGLEVGPNRAVLDRAMATMAEEGAGVLLYLRPDGDKEPLDERVRRYGAMARGERVAPVAAGPSGFYDFGIGAQILRALGVGKLRVISSRPRVFKGLSGYGLEIVEWVSLSEPKADADSLGSSPARV